VDPAAADVGVGVGHGCADQASVLLDHQHRRRPGIAEVRQLEPHLVAHSADVAGRGSRVGLFGDDQVEDGVRFVGRDRADVCHEAILSRPTWHLQPLGLLPQ